jgi:hypothetical protein
MRNKSFLKDNIGILININGKLSNIAQLNTLLQYSLGTCKSIACFIVINTVILIFTNYTYTCKPLTLYPQRGRRYSSEKRAIRNTADRHFCSYFYIYFLNTTRLDILITFNVLCNITQKIIW